MWAVLLVDFPESWDIEDVLERFKNVAGVVIYAEADYVGQLLATANDEYYTNPGPGFAYAQYNLHFIDNIYGSVKYHINIEPAWDIVQSGGAKEIRAGIFDTGVRWKNQDFGYNGTIGSSKVVKGYHYDNNMNMIMDPTHDIDVFSHGTDVAGIIGAIRNNIVGIAGIAGGDFVNDANMNDRGISLYSARIMGFQNANTIYYHEAAKAIYESSIRDDQTLVNWGLHIQNHSWRIGNNIPAQLATGPLYIDSNITLIREAVHAANRNGVCIVAGRGNEGNTNMTYPACLDDDWVVNVSGTGIDGTLATVTNSDYNSSYGNGIDIGAPSTNQLNYTTCNYTDLCYHKFGKTSSAAPHVSGVIGLLMSYLNEPSGNPHYNNLSHEDAEHIIELSAKKYSPQTVYDDYNGHGRLDAGRALQIVEKPGNTLYHKGTNAVANTTHTITVAMLVSNATINLTESYKNEAGDWFAKGPYQVKKYSLTDIMDYNLNTDDLVVAHWARNSKSSLLADYDGSNQLVPHEKLTINSLTENTASVTGYFYEVEDMLGNPLGWWPADFQTNPNDADLEISILAHNINAWPNALPESIRDELKYAIYPNPSCEKHTIEIFSTSSATESFCALFDLSGRKIGEYSFMKGANGNLYLENNLEKLDSGIYLYKVNVSGNSFIIKATKQ